MFLILHGFYGQFQSSNFLVIAKVLIIEYKCKTLQQEKCHVDSVPGFCAFIITESRKISDLVLTTVLCKRIFDIAFWIFWHTWCTFFYETGLRYRPNRLVKIYLWAVLQAKRSCPLEIKAGTVCPCKCTHGPNLIRCFLI